MVFKKVHWFWNVLLVVTIVICFSVLILHYKNWVDKDTNSLDLMSGFYRISIPYNEMDSIYFVDKIPPMERLNGFSALEKEKGIFREFKDSLTNKKVYVFVDNINQQKIKLVYKDSFNLFVNVKDSIASLGLMEDLQKKMAAVKIEN